MVARGPAARGTTAPSGRRRRGRSSTRTSSSMRTRSPASARRLQPIPTWRPCSARTTTVPRRRAQSPGSATSSTITSTRARPAPCAASGRARCSSSRAVLRRRGFDADRYPRPSIEDVELGARLAAGGARIRSTPSSRARTSRRGASWTWCVPTSSTAASRFGLLARQRHAPAELNLARRHRLGTALSIAAVAAAVTRRPAVAAARSRRSWR